MLISFFLDVGDLLENGFPFVGILHPDVHVFIKPRNGLQFEGRQELT